LVDKRRSERRGAIHVGSSPTLGTMSTEREKEMKKKGIYAGSFDLLTDGHYEMIKEGSKLFDELIVVVASDPKKKYMFSVEERAAMLRIVCQEFPNVVVKTLPERMMLPIFAKAENVKYILRGIRNIADFDAEYTLQVTYRGINSDVSCVYLVLSPLLCNRSSSTVKALLGYDGWEEEVAKYVPKQILEVLIARSNKD